jgi:hypothetical protein
VGQDFEAHRSIVGTFDDPHLQFWAEFLDPLGKSSSLVTAIRPELPQLGEQPSHPVQDVRGVVTSIRLTVRQADILMAMMAGFWTRAGDGAAGEPVGQYLHCGCRRCWFGVESDAPGRHHSYHRAVPTHRGSPQITGNHSV